MQITEVRLRKINSENRMKAVASVTFDGCFVVHDIKVIEREDKPLLVVMPSKRTPKGENKDVAHPINQETREMISKAVLEKYENPDEETSEPIEE
ncbi:MAG: septation regulator SpoVG [Clostridia bacterium]|nr:septation regulator SpoVG [Clostridia bacterium]